MENIVTVCQAMSMRPKELDEWSLPSVSVIIPAFNAGARLLLTLDMLLGLWVLSQE